MFKKNNKIEKNNNKKTKQKNKTKQYMHGWLPSDHTKLDFFFKI